VATETAAAAVAAAVAMLPAVYQVRPAGGWVEKATVMLEAEAEVEGISLRKALAS
jgi:hypothetical protein